MLNNYFASYKGLSKQVWLLAFVMLVNRSGTMVIPFLSIYMTRSLGFSLEESGVVLMFFGIGAVLGNFFGGKLSDHFGYYPILLGSMFFTGVMFLLMEHVKSFIGLTSVVLLTTIIADIFRPANMSALAAQSTPENRTRSISLIRLSYNLGWAIAPAVGGLAIAWYGYHWLFRLDGLTCIAASILIFALVQSTSNQTQKKVREQTSSLKSNDKIPPILLWFLTANLVTMIGFLQIVSTLPVYFRSEVGLSEEIIGGLMALNGVFIAFFEMPFVFKYESRFSPMKFIIAGTFIFGISYLVFNLGASLLMCILCILLLSIGEIFQMPFANAWILELAPEDKIGRYMSYYGISFSLSFIISPLLGMYLAEHFGYNTMWNIMSILVLFSTLGFYGIERYKNKPTNIHQ